MLPERDAFELIDRAPVARLAQLDLEKQVHAIPFVFVRDGSTLYSPVDGKPKRHAKLSRLAWAVQEPAVTVLIDEYDTDWTQLWWLRIYGQAKQIDSNIPCWASVVKKLSAKYPQYQSTPMFSGAPTMLSIDIERWRYWAAADKA